MKNERSEIILLLTLLLLFSFGVNLLVRASQQPPAPVPTAIGTPQVLPVVPVEEPISNVGLPAGSTTAAPVSVQPRAPQPAVPLAAVGPGGQVMVPTFVPAPLQAGQSLPMSANAMTPVTSAVPVATPQTVVPTTSIPAPVQALPVGAVVPTAVAPSAGSTAATVVPAVPVVAGAAVVPAAQPAVVAVTTVAPATAASQPTTAAPVPATAASTPVIGASPTAAPITPTTVPAGTPVAPQGGKPAVQKPAAIPTPAAVPVPATTAQPAKPTTVIIPAPVVQPAPKTPVQPKIENQKPEKEESELSPGEGDLAALPTNKIIDFFKFNIAAHNDDVIVKAMRNLPLENARKFVKDLVGADLERPIKLQILFGLANYYADQNAKFSLFDNAAPLLEDDDVPALYVAARGMYPMIITPLVAWMKTKNINTDEAIKTALIYAINKNGLESIKKFQEHTKLLYGDRATDLLWDAIDRHVKASIVQFLIDQGADLNANRDGDTVLVRAAKALNLGAVKAIVESAEKNKFDMNKFMNRFADPAHDTPLQAVTKIQINSNRSRKDKRKAVKVEEYLRAHGASENL